MEREQQKDLVCLKLEAMSVEMLGYAISYLAAIFQCARWGSVEQTAFCMSRAGTFAACSLYCSATRKRLAEGWLDVSDLGRAT